MRLGGEKKDEHNHQHGVRGEIKPMRESAFSGKGTASEGIKINFNIMEAFGEDQEKVFSQPRKGSVGGERLQYTPGENRSSTGEAEGGRSTHQKRGGGSLDQVMKEGGGEF